MDLQKIGSFIKELRVEKNMSQKKVADMIPIDRTVISKWENGDLLPPIDKMKILCELFGVSIDELISGEKSNNKNKKEHQNKLFDFLIKNESKYEKTKKGFTIVSIFLFIAIIFFLVYYFFQTYNTEKIYRVYTLSDDYIIKNGVLVTTRESSFLKIGSINDKNYHITIYYKEKNDNIVIFNGDSDSLIIDFYVYGRAINSKNISEIRDNLYLKIDDNDIKLYLKEYYKNDNLIIEDSDDYYYFKDEQSKTINDEIPTKIITEFVCDESFCNKTIGEIKLDYLIEDEVLFLKENNIKIQYDISNNSFDFTSPEISFLINNGDFFCYSERCDDYQTMYEKYYTNIIKKYIE